MSMVRLTISVPKEDADLVRSLAGKADRSDSYIIRHAIALLRSAHVGNPSQLELDLSKKLL
jgi:predicted transcriptional regulator